jgi:hypothetical protein
MDFSRCKKGDMVIGGDMERKPWRGTALSKIMGYSRYPHLTIISISPCYTPCMVFFLERLD